MAISDLINLSMLMNEAKKEGEDTAHFDVGGAFEAVPGVQSNGNPVRNYKPDWVLELGPRFVSSVPEAAFKFFSYKKGGTIF